MKTLAMWLLLMGTAFADPPSVHGMLLAGKQTLYFSHLPMFHRPHDYQVLIEATLDGPAAAKYVQDRERTGTRLYTIVPERFDLSALPPTFKTQVVRGHFERGGQKIVAAAQATVVHVAHFRKLDPNAARPAEATYLLFGHGDETYLAHYITAKPNFDQVLQVKVPAGLVGDDAAVVTIPGAPDATPLQENTTVTAKLGTQTVTVEIGEQLYLEFDDLSM